MRSMAINLDVNDISDTGFSQLEPTLTSRGHHRTNCLLKNGLGKCTGVEDASLP